MNKTLLTMARQIHRRLLAHRPADPFQGLLEEVRQIQWQWSDTCQRHEQARTRGWLQAASGVRRELVQEAARLVEKLNLLQALESASQPPVASLALIIEELEQLSLEFENVQLLFDAYQQPTIQATTDPITLEEVELGRFIIQLEVGRLDRQRNAGSFRCIALDPNPAASNSEVTHPHVSEEKLCAGEASLPISNALAQGRISDAFCLVRSVLNTYNSASPYVALEDWVGVRCTDCEEFVQANELYHCAHCGYGYCDNCISSCDLCNQSACAGCLERDGRSHQDCCPNCRETCARCGRVVNNDDYNQETELCPQCHDKENHEPNDDNGSNDNPPDEQEPHDREHTDHEYTEQPALCGPAEDDLARVRAP